MAPGPSMGWIRRHFRRLSISCVCIQCLWDIRITYPFHRVEQSIAVFKLLEVYTVISKKSRKIGTKIWVHKIFYPRDTYRKMYFDWISWSPIRLKWLLSTDKRANKFATYFGTFSFCERCYRGTSTTVRHILNWIASCHFHVDIDEACFSQ